MTNKKYPKIIVKRFFSDKGNLTTSFINAATRVTETNKEHIAQSKYQLAGKKEMCYNIFDVVCCENKED